MKVIGDICYPTSKYQDRQSGEEKTRWSRCGVLLQKESGEFRIKLELIPFSVGEGWFSVFEPRQQEQGAPQSAPAPKAGFRNAPEPGTTGDIPW